MEDGKVVVNCDYSNGTDYSCEVQIKKVGEHYIVIGEKIILNNAL
jgi:hypothetical protein